MSRISSKNCARYATNNTRNSKEVTNQHTSTTIRMDKRSDAKNGTARAAAPDVRNLSSTSDSATMTAPSPCNWRCPPMYSVWASLPLMASPYYPPIPLTACHCCCNRTASSTINHCSPHRLRAEQSQAQSTRCAHNNYHLFAPMIQIPLHHHALPLCCTSPSPSPHLVVGPRDDRHGGACTCHTTQGSGCPRTDSSRRNIAPCVSKAATSDMRNPLTVPLDIVSFTDCEGRVWLPDCEQRRCAEARNDAGQSREAVSTGATRKVITAVAPTPSAQVNRRADDPTYKAPMRTMLQSDKNTAPAKCSCSRQSGSMRRSPERTRKISASLPIGHTRRRPSPAKSFPRDELSSLKAQTSSGVKSATRKKEADGSCEYLRIKNDAFSTSDPDNDQPNSYNSLTDPDNRLAFTRGQTPTTLLEHDNHRSTRRTRVQVNGHTQEYDSSCWAMTSNASSASDISIVANTARIASSPFQQYDTNVDAPSPQSILKYAKKIRSEELFTLGNHCRYSSDTRMLETTGRVPKEDVSLCGRSVTNRTGATVRPMAKFGDLNLEEGGRSRPREARDATFQHAVPHHSDRNVSNLPRERAQNVQHFEQQHFPLNGSFVNRSSAFSFGEHNLISGRGFGSIPTMAEARNENRLNERVISNLPTTERMHCFNRFSNETWPLSEGHGIIDSERTSGSPHATGGFQRLNDETMNFRPITANNNCMLDTNNTRALNDRSTISGNAALSIIRDTTLNLPSTGYSHASSRLSTPVATDRRPPGILAGAPLNADVPLEDNYHRNRMPQLASAASDALSRNSVSMCCGCHAEHVNSNVDTMHRRSNRHVAFDMPYAELRSTRGLDARRRSDLRRQTNITRREPMQMDEEHVTDRRPRSANTVSSINQTKRNPKLEEELVRMQKFDIRCVKSSSSDPDMKDKETRVSSLTNSEHREFETDGFQENDDAMENNTLEKQDKEKKGKLEPYYEDC